MRPSEWLFVCYFGYVVILSAFFRDRPHLHEQPVVYLLATAAFFLLLTKLQRAPIDKLIAGLRDWLPIAFLVIAFREMELFVPKTYNLFFEGSWIKLDQLAMNAWGVQAAIESLGKTLPFYLEACYLLVYGLPAFSLAWIVARPDPRRVNYFWIVYLTGTLTAYGLFPFFPSLPPRYAYPLIAQPAVTTWVRTINLDILSKATIHSGVFPSAHVSSAFSAVWALYFLFPHRPWLVGVMLTYAISVSIATVYGRYHYIADVLGGFAISLIALGVGFAMKKYVQEH